MRSRSGTVRMIEAQHPRDKLELLGAATPLPDAGA
jgi:hypothetical protein